MNAKVYEKGAIKALTVASCRVIFNDVKAAFMLEVQYLLTWIHGLHETCRHTFCYGDDFIFENATNFHARTARVSNWKLTEDIKHYINLESSINHFQ